MAVLQFAFGGKADNLYLPHNQRANSVVYPGTHDNDTTLGWYAARRKNPRSCPPLPAGERREISWDFIRCAYASIANLAVIPLQDLLNLGSNALQHPGSQGNWTWRYRPAQLRALRDGVFGLSARTGRGSMAARRNKNQSKDANR